MSRELTSSGVHRIWAEVSVAMAVFAAVFAACLIGILSRPAGLLASVWPANAVLLGLLLRWPPAGRPMPLIAAALAYVLADLATGASLVRAVSLNLANLASVAAAYAVLSHLAPGVRRLAYPGALFWVVFAAAVGGVAAGQVGYWVSPSSYRDPLLSFAMWSVTETANYLATLPVILSAPGREVWVQRRYRTRSRRRRRDLLPAASVLVSCVAAALIGGPGAISVPVLALLWCGMVYPVFPITLLTLVFGLFALGTFAAPLFLAEGASANGAALISLRIGVSVVGLMPVLLAILMRGRNELTAQLRHLAHHDGLTGIQNRTAFTERAGLALANSRTPLALLLMDLDRFKYVNDTWGHAAGDEVLVETVRRVGDVLRASDHFSRLGGEEFAILLTDCRPDQALATAERARRAVEAAPIRLADGQEIPVTISIGLVTVRGPTAEPLAKIMSRADRCLYTAKAEGRNRIVMAPPSDGIIDIGDPGPARQSGG